MLSFILLSIYTMHTRREKRKLTEANLGQHFLKSLGGFGTFCSVRRHLHFACSLYNLPRRLPHCRNSNSHIQNCLPQISSLLAGGLLQCGHDRKATCHQSKHAPVRSQPLPRENKAKPLSSYVRRNTTSRPG